MLLGCVYHVGRTGPLAHFRHKSYRLGAFRRICQPGNHAWGYGPERRLSAHTPAVQGLAAFSEYRGFNRFRHNNGRSVRGTNLLLLAAQSTRTYTANPCRDPVNLYLFINLCNHPEVAKYSSTRNPLGQAWQLSVASIKTNLGRCLSTSVPSSLRNLRSSGVASAGERYGGLPSLPGRTPLYK